MSLMVKVIKVPSPIIVPLTKFLRDGRVNVDGWEIGWPSNKGTISVAAGNISFNPDLRISGGLITLTVSSAKVSPDKDEILFDINSSPIDVKLA